MNQLKNILVFFVLILIPAVGFTQNISINADGSPPDNSAMLDVADTSRGFLLPRMSTTQMNNIAGPANGLFIYNTDSSAFMYFDGISWQMLGSGAVGSSGVNTEWQEYTPTFVGLGTVTDIKVLYRREGTDLLLRGNFREGVGTAVVATLSLPSGLSILSTVDSIELAGTVTYGGGAHGGHHAVLIQPDSTHIAFGHSTNVLGGLTKETGTILFGSNALMSFFARIPIQGWSANSSGVNISEGGSSVDSAGNSGVLILKDVKGFAIDGGTFTSGSWQTRDLNTKEGDTSFVSLSSNEFTLATGVYLIEASAPAFRVGLHRVRIYNVSDASLELMGQNQFSINNTSADQTNATVQGIIDIASSKTFRLEHRGQSTQATNGFGPTHAIAGETELYSQIKIIKLDQVFGSSTSFADSTGSSIADTLDENIFTARITNNGTAAIASQNVNFISSVNRTALGTITVTFEPGFFTVTPAVTANTNNDATARAAITGLSTTGFTLLTNEVTSSTTYWDRDVSIVVANQGVDYKYNTSGGSGSGGSSVADTLDENTFGAVIANNGTASITSQTLDFIQSVNRSSAGTVDITYTPGYFTVAPSVIGVVDYSASNRNLSITASTNTGCRVVITTGNSSSAYEDRDFHISVTRQGADYKYNTSGASASALNNSGDTTSLISDTDGDTKINVELNNDEDSIRFISEGVEVMSIDSSNVTFNKGIILPETLSDSSGVIFKNGVRFLHTYNDPAAPFSGRNIYIGENAGNFTQDMNAELNTGVGWQSLNRVTSGGANAAFGYRSLDAVESGRQNTAIGYNSMRNDTIGSFNTAVGAASMRFTNGDLNTAVGHNSMRLAFGTTVQGNTAVGAQTLYNIRGKHNVAIGDSAGYNNFSGDRNVFIGSKAGLNELGSYKLYIANDSTDQPLIWGDFATDSLKVYGTLSIGDSTTFPTGRGNNGQVLTSDGAGGIVWQNASGGISDQIQDGDGNTQIQLEETANDDIIRFDMNGTEFFRMDSGRIEVLNTGNSIMIGDSAGFYDDYSNNQNIYLGTNTGRFNTSGYRNIGIGIGALEQNISGYNNIALGYRAGSANLAHSNILIGNNTSDGSNVNNTSVLIGHDVLTNSASGNLNSVVGHYALANIFSGHSNSVVGFEAGNDLTQSTANVIMGRDALGNANTADSNVVIGYEAGKAATNLKRSVLIGLQAGTNATGNDQLYIENSDSIHPLIYGDFANDSIKIYGTLSIGDSTTFPTGRGYNGQVLTSDGAGGIVWQNAGGISAEMADADNDTKVQVEENADEDIIRFDQGGTEYFTMKTGRLGVVNTGQSIFIGEGAGANDDLSNNQNIFIGDSAGAKSTTRPHNVAIGYFSMYSADSPNNTAIGYATLQNVISPGQQNVAVGWSALQSNTTGGTNTAVGSNSLNRTTTGNRNTALGYRTLMFNVVGDSNVAVGYQSLENNTASFNTALGASAMESNTSGVQNVSLGANSGYSNSTGSRNVYIGYGSGYSATGSDKLYIENSISNTPLIYGNFASDSIKIYGTLSIGDSTTFPTNRGANGQVLTSDGAGGISWQNAGGSSQWTTIGSDIYFNTGLVGVGTSSPENHLSVIYPGATIAAESSAIQFGDNFGTAYLGAGSSSISLFGDDSTEFINVRQSDGHIGIGTNSPTALLAVQADGTGEDNGFKLIGNSGTKGVMIYSDGSGIAELANSSGAKNIKFDGGDGRISYINTGGDLGLGTANPTAKLTISDAGNVSARINSYATTLAEAPSYILYKSRGTESTPSAIVNGDNVGKLTAAAYDGAAYSNVAKIQFEIDNTPGVGDTPGRIQFHTTADGSGTTTERMRINSEGNIGIGTTSPETKLHIAGGSDASLALDGHFVMGDVTSINMVLDQNEIIARNNGAASDLYINNEGGNVIFSSHTAGSVGIGTSAPIGELTLAGTDSTDLFLFGKSAVNHRQAITFGYNNGANLIGRMDVDNNSMDFLASNGRSIDFYTQGAQAGSGLDTASSLELGMSISGDGFVGIGTFNPENKFHVYNGSLKIEQTGTGSGYNNMMFLSNATNHSLVTRYNYDVNSSIPDSVWQFRSSGANAKGFVFSKTDGTVLLSLGSQDASSVGIGISDPTSKFEVDGDIEIDAGGATGSDAFYFGDPSTNGTWRIIRDGDDLSFERREAGAWVFKMKINP